MNVFFCSFYFLFCFIIFNRFTSGYWNKNKKNYTNEVAENVSILYGGSVKPTNAKEIFSKQDVDGGLIGGAALKADDFTAIIKAI